MKILYKPTFILIFLTVLIGAENCRKNKTANVWFCPMHPTYTSDKPGTCPICNMNLVEKKEESGSHDAHNSEKTSSLTLSEEYQEMIGIRTEKAVFRKLMRKIRSPGSIAYDPELYTTVLEYREALKNYSPQEPSDSSEKILIESARSKLAQLGLSAAQIREWARPGKDPSELVLGGKKGKGLVYAQLYESDISWVKSGMQFIMKTDSFPGKVFSGKIINIDNTLDVKTRTLRIRGEVSDPSNNLKPGMYAELEIEAHMEKALSVPKTSLLDTGKRQILYVRTGSTSFIPRQVTIGRETDDFIEIRKGVKDGEEVVVAGNFLLDSEARLKLPDSEAQPTLELHKH